MTAIRHIFAVLALLALAVPGLAAEARRSAREAVDDYIDTLLDRVEEIKPLYESDRARYDRAVEQALSGFVDFREVARGVMAKYGTGPNGATEEQLGRFAAVFKDSMIDFYGSALASYGGQDYEFLENRREPSDPANASPVRMSIAADDGGRFELQYVMFLDASGQWKLKNLYVEGVNLRRQYYSRFDDLMARNDYDIERVIENWQE